MTKTKQTNKKKTVDQFHLLIQKSYIKCQQAESNSVLKNLYHDQVDNTPWMQR